MRSQEDRERGAAFALTCQIPQFLQLPSDIQLGLVDAMVRLGCTEFACLFFLRSHIECGDLDKVRHLLIYLNKHA